jgi:hypothetical protein
MLVAAAVLDAGMQEDFLQVAQVAQVAVVMVAHQLLQL